MSTNISELTDKEKILVWSIIAWFQAEGLVSGSLVRKFYPNLDDKQYRYDERIEDKRIKAKDEFTRPPRGKR